MDSKTLNKQLKQGLTASELADTLEAGCSTNQGAVPKTKKVSPSKPGPLGPTMIRQNPAEMRKFRPPLGRTGAVVPPAPRDGDRKAGTRNFAKAEKGSPYYIPTSADFADDEPGGKRDRNLRHLSGAQQKWYRRALLEGDTPDVAINKAKPRGNAQAKPRANTQAKPRGNTQAAPKGKDTGKRGLSEDSLRTEAQPSKFSRTMKGGAELRKPGPKPHRQPRQETAEGGIGMAILDAKYPSKLMSESEMRKVEDFLIGKVVEGWTSKIRIHNLKLGPGYITLKAEDSQTAAWLRQAIWAGNTSLKLDLKVVEGSEIPVTRLITMFLPRAEKMTRKDILSAIKNSNDLETERWLVMSDDIAKDKEGREVGRTLKALVDEHQQKKLADMKNVVHFIFGTVDVYGARSARAEAQAPTSTGPTPTEGPTEVSSMVADTDLVLPIDVDASPVIVMADDPVKDEDISMEQEDLLLKEPEEVSEEPKGNNPQGPGAPKQD